MQNIDSSDTLVVMLHGYNGTPSSFDSLKKTVLECYPNAEIFAPQLPLSILSTAKIEDIIKKVIQEIDKLWQQLSVDKRNTFKIILIGNSMGGLIIRKVYLESCERYFLNKEKSCEWVDKVDRVIYFAAMLKGWALNAHYNTGSYLLFKLLEVVGKSVLFFGMKPVGFDFKRGSPFITELRIQSLKLNKLGYGNALAIQLLGTQDDIVSPDDNIDLVTGKQFIYIDMPFSDHFNVMKLDDDNGLKRKEIVIKSLVCEKEELRKSEVIPSDENYIIQDETVTDVVFVIHGIRDLGYWTIKLANKVKSLGERQQNKKYKTETSTYGYFPMGAFLLKQFRTSKVEWLMDRYTENMAYYPNAKFSFVGHSNGTYLLARALQNYPSCEFKNIVLAGSVVKDDFNWKYFIDKGRVKSIYNFVANNDWVVGIFPKTFQTLKIQDLGSGGFDGFKQLADGEQFKFISGGHGAAVEEKVWNDVAYVAVHGELPSCNNVPAKSHRSELMKLIGYISPIIVLTIFILLILFGYLIYKNNNGLLLTIYMVSYFYFLYKILTWF